MPMISALNLNIEDFSSYRAVGGTNLSTFEPLSRINIIVGSNNSGKSRFVRLLSTQKQYQVHLEHLNIRELNNSLSNAIRTLIEVFTDYGYTEINQIRLSDLNSRLNLPEALNNDSDAYHDYRVDFESWARITQINSSASSGNRRYNPNDQAVVEQIKFIASEAVKALSGVPVRTPSNTLKRVYIPILRGLRPLDDDHTDFYEDRTRKDYFANVAIRSTKHDAPEIFSGLKFYDKLMEMLLGTNQKRKIIYDYQKFLSKTFFEGQDVVLIPDRDAKVVSVKLGDEADQPIFHLGEGVQSAIILSFLPYITKEATFFFIEEPESHMHPGLQRKVIDFMASRECEQHTFFLTCHSNHLLDLTIDLQSVSVFTFRKQLEAGGGDEQLAKVTVEAIDSAHESSLELLGVRNSSVFLVNSTIWVEGITDRFYLRSILKSYVEYLRHESNVESGEMNYFFPEEDVHYCFVEYGGANITHWSFLESEQPQVEVKRLCGRAMVIVDRDGDKKMKRREALEANLGERLIVLDGREIENILPPNVIRAVIADYEGIDILQVPELSYEKYQEKYLGTFIDRFLRESEIQSRRTTYSNRKLDANGEIKGSGTIREKVDFCDRALKYLNELAFNELPELTQSLAVRMYQFIEKNN